jgi:hypothetical protein
MVCFSLIFPMKIYTNVLVPLDAIHPANLIFLGLTVLVIFGEELML